jgi:hypothetical protein
MILNAAQFILGDKTKTLIAEISSLGIKGPTQTFSLQGWPRQGVETVFRCYKTEMDASNEDVAGWRYRDGQGQELLIIND